jgi:hypothetical protein
VWAARSDGALLSLTHNPGGGVRAWTRHDLQASADNVRGFGRVESIACIPEGDEDGVYLVVLRGADRFFERMAYRLLPPVVAADDVPPGEPVVDDHRYAIHLDQAASYNGRIDEEVSIVTGVAAGESIEIVVANDPAALAEGDTIQLDDPEGIEPYTLELTSDDGGGAWTAQVMGRDMTDLTGETFTHLWRCSNSVTGLNHLIGEDVTALVGGVVVEGLSVVAGTCDLGAPAPIAHVGLAFDWEAQGLPSPRDRTRTKTTTEVMIEAMRVGNFEAGQALLTPEGEAADLREAPTTQLLNGVPVRTRDPFTVSGSWAQAGSVALRGSDPLPIEIYSVTKEVTLGG